MIAISENPLVSSGCIKRGFQELGEAVKLIDFPQIKADISRSSNACRLRVWDYGIGETNRLDL